jgi:hypothetical protein
MNESSDRIPCPHCQASNFPSSSTCWQCGRPMRSQDQTPQGPAQPPQGPGLPPPGASSPYPSTLPRSGSNVLIILGWVFAVLALLPSCCGWLFAIIALILGIVAYSQGDKRGLYVIIGAVVIAIISTAAWSALGHYFMNNPPPWLRNMPNSPWHPGGPGAPGGAPGFPAPKAMPMPK